MSNNIIQLIEYLENEKQNNNIISNKVLFEYFNKTICLFVLSYPIQPNDVIKKKMYDFIMNLPIFISDNNISKYIEEYIDNNPINPYLDNRKSLMKWCYMFLEELRKYIFQIKKEDYEYNQNYYDLWNNFINIFCLDENIRNEIERKYNSKTLLNNNVDKSFNIKKYLLNEIIKVKKLYKNHKHKVSISFLIICIMIIIYIMYIQNEN